MPTPMEQDIPKIGQPPMGMMPPGMVPPGFPVPPQGMPLLPPRGMIPPGMGNGYYVFSPTAVYHYKLAYTGNYIDADQQFTINWNNPKLNITWPVNNPILSDRDEG